MAMSGPPTTQPIALTEAWSITTDLALSCQRILEHLKRRWGIEVMFKALREHFGLGDCRCRGGGEPGALGGASSFGLCVSRPDSLGQAVAKGKAELGRGSGGDGMESDLDGYRGEGVARYPGAVDSWGVSVFLPRFHPQGTPGGQLDFVKDLC